MHYILPQLPYAYDALEPYIDAKTMEIHYTKHHQAYVDNLNKALHDYPALQQQDLTTLLVSLDSVPATIRAAVRNNGGGHVNHSFFWQLMGKKDSSKPTGTLKTAIEKQLGGIDSFCVAFSAAARTLFGSGWAWLVVDKAGALSVIALPNQDSPLMQGLTPVIGLDVWEHAYYLQYQNRRADYIDAWWHVLNWRQAEENYKATGV